MVADRLNFYRFLSHFRCVHRGTFFSQMRTTSVRKLLPEAWGMLFSIKNLSSVSLSSFVVSVFFLFYVEGFLCPVHTPDGAPCGLLNHLSASCQVNFVIT